MARTWMFAVVFAIFGATPAQAELEIQNIQPCHGPLGPTRNNLNIAPHDEIMFRFDVVGAQVDAEGKIDVTQRMRLTGGDGKVLLDLKKSLKGRLALGGKRFPGAAIVSFREAVPAGAYTFTVTVTDNLASSSATFERQLTSKPLDLAIVAPQFFYDAAGRVPAPAGGLVGQVLYFRLKVDNFDRGEKKIDAEMQVQILDGKGVDQTQKPIVMTIKEEEAEIVQETPYLSFDGSLLLNRAGDFMLRITVIDRMAKKKTRFETPLHVNAP